MLSRLRAQPRDPAETPAESDIGTDTLAFLRSHGIPADPRYYALIHEALADRTSLAAHAIHEAEERDGKFSLEAADAILAERAGPEELDDATLAGQEKLRHQTLHLADIAAAATEATGRFSRELSAGLSNGGQSVHSIHAMISAMIDRTSNTERELAAAVQQIDKLREEVAEARNDAMRDSLTGLLNRRGIIETVAALDDRPRMVALCDIDRFKAINDGHGHDVGDRVLKVIATALERGCGSHLVGRWGGEEFIVVLNTADAEAAVDIIDNIRIELSCRQLKARETGAPLGMVTFSAGLSALDEPFDDALRAADALLYQAKLAGRNRVLAPPPAAQAA